MRRRVGGLIAAVFGVAMFAVPGAPEARMIGVEDAPANAEDVVLFGADPNIPPTKRKAMLAWLAEKRYLEGYTAEPAVHPSEGPHGGNVRTFFNSILVEDLRAGRTSFRKGAAMVKELYFGSTDTVRGYAVMVKVKKNAGSTGQGWLFMETFNGTQADFYGRGIGICADCHGAGTDYLLSEFRP